MSEQRCETCGYWKPGDPCGECSVPVPPPEANSEYMPAGSCGIWRRTPPGYCCTNTASTRCQWRAKDDAPRGANPYVGPGLAPPDCLDFDPYARHKATGRSIHKPMEGNPAVVSLEVAQKLAPHWPQGELPRQCYTTVSDGTALGQKWKCVSVDDATTVAFPWSSSIPAPDFEELGAEAKRRGWSEEIPRSAYAVSLTKVGPERVWGTSAISDANALGHALLAAIEADKVATLKSNAAFDETETPR